MSPQPHRWLRAAIVSSLLGLPTLARAETTSRRPDLIFLLDPDMSMDPGVRSTLSLSRLVFRYDEALRPDSERQGAALGWQSLGRALKVVFVDYPLASTAITFSHEVFGHGARAREQGLETTYRFRLPQPYRAALGDSSPESAEAFFDHQRQEDRNLALVVGGIESDARMAHWISQDMVQFGGADYGDMLIYLFARLSYASSFLNPGGEKEAFDDVYNYVTLLQNRFNRGTDADRRSIESKLRTAYLWHLADPMLFFAAYGVFVGHIVEGQRWMKIPLPSVGDIRFLPRTTLVPSPFGAEHLLDVSVALPSVVIEVQGRMGTSGLASYGGGGVGISRLQPLPFLQLAWRVDMWSQPQILWDDRNVFDRPNRFGASMGTEGTFSLSPSMAFMLAIAYKSSGFLPAQPMNQGLYGSTGLRWSVP